VHPDFKVIVIALASEVYNKQEQKYDSSFLTRFEKQYLYFNDFWNS